jgi:hypothetical protein
MHKATKRVQPGEALRMARLTLALASLAAVATPLHAMDIDTGSEDFKLRWDNTFRYNVGMRAQQIDPAISADPIADEGTNSFGKNDIVTNRLDILSEMDFVYQGTMGARVSAAGWYDDAYKGKSPAIRRCCCLRCPGTARFPRCARRFPMAGNC